MFKRPFCQSDIVLGCIVCSHSCVVDYTGGQTFVVKRALVFVTAIALYLVICVGVIVGISYFLVVFVNDRFHVVHTAVANFDVILVEKAVVFVLFREVLRNKFEESSADVSLAAELSSNLFLSTSRNSTNTTDFQVPPRKQVLP